MSTADIRELTVELKSINDAVKGITDEYKGFNASIRETRAAMDDQVKAVKKLEDAFTDLEIRMQKNGQYVVKDRKAAVFAIPEVKGLFEALRTGVAKSAAITEGPSGGYAVHNEWLNFVMDKVRDIDDIRAHATVVSIASSALEVPVEDGEAGLDWVGELEERADTTAPTIGKVTIPVHECNAVVSVTKELIADASFSIEDWITSKVIDHVARGEARAFVSGTGTKQPEGLWTCDRIETISGTASTLADDMLDMTARVPWAMDTECAFVMNKATEVALRKLKDTTGQYLWQPALTQGMPSTFAGYPIVRAPSAPGISDGEPIIFGALKDYMVVDRQGVEMIRDESSKEMRKYGIVEYQLNARIGGAVVQPDSFVKLSME